MTPEAIRRVVKALGLVCFTIGGFGCVLCLPFAISTNMIFVAAAGIYFVAGGIMIIGGLVTYALLIKEETA